MADQQSGLRDTIDSLIRQAFQKASQLAPGATPAQTINDPYAAAGEYGAPEGAYQQTAAGVTGGGGGARTGGRAPVTGATPEPQGIDFSPAANVFKGMMQQAEEGGPATRNLGRAAAYAPVGYQAVQALLQGHPAEAAAGLAAGGGAAALTRAVGRGVGGKLGAALQFAAPLVGLGASQAAGGAAQRAVQRATGEGDQTQLSTQLGQTQQLMNLFSSQSQQQRDQYVRMMQQLAQNQMQTDIDMYKAQFPLIEQAKRNELVRQQALVNTMGQNYAMLGTVATAGKLAERSQMEAGANLRTALTAAPYANAVLQAPNISFG